MSREVMYALVALLVAVALVMYLERRREHLEMNDKVKLVEDGYKYDKDESMRRLNMVPADMKQDFIEYTKQNPKNPFGPQPMNVRTPEELAAQGISGMVDAAVREIYQPATKPITVNDIDTFINTKITPSLSEKSDMGRMFAKHVRNGNYKTLLISYLIGDTPEPQPAPVLTPIPQIQAPTDFSQAVDIYKNTYVQYKTTGRIEYKTAYENAESWIQEYLKSMENKVSNGRQSITSFVNQNAGADTELGVLGDRMKTIKKEGPESQDAYITIKRIQDDIPEDNTDLYVKIGMVIAFIGVAAVI